MNPPPGQVTVATAQILWWGIKLAPAVYGIYLAFKASILLGIVAIVLEPLALIIGLAGMFGHPHLAEQLVKLITSWGLT